MYNINHISMPYKDIEKRREAWREGRRKYYKKNKEKILKKKREDYREAKGMTNKQGTRG